MVTLSAPLGPVIGPLMGFPPNLKEAKRASHNVTYWVRDDKARERLGYDPRDLETGLRETLADAGLGARARSRTTGPPWLMQLTGTSSHSSTITIRSHPSAVQAYEPCIVQELPESSTELPPAVTPPPPDRGSERDVGALAGDLEDADGEARGAVEAGARGHGQLDPVAVRVRQVVLGRPVAAGHSEDRLPGLRRRVEDVARNEGLELLAAADHAQVGQVDDADVAPGPPLTALSRLPSAASRRSAPAPPRIRSLPAPPVRRSLPAPPSTRSAPARPFARS